MADGPSKPTLDGLFKSKAKKKPKPTNFKQEGPPPPVERPKLRPPPGERNAAEEGWEKALRRDQELLKACGLSMKELEADGACLFRAFADQLEGDGGAAHASYRERCVDFLEANRVDFEPFLELEAGEDFSGYCSRMRGPASWGGHVEAQALSQALAVNALIYKPSEAGKAENLAGTAVPIVTSDSADTKCLQLSFHPTHHAGEHYNSVRRVADDSDSAAPGASIDDLRKSIEEALKPPVVAPKEKESLEPMPKTGIHASAKVF